MKPPSIVKHTGQTIVLNYGLNTQLIWFAFLFLLEGILYYRHGSKLRQVLRSREEVVHVLKEHHDKRGHFGMTRCLNSISELFYWGTLTRDVEEWIGNCQFCMEMDETTQKYRCAVYSCNNYNGPLERTLGLTFHRYAMHLLQLICNCKVNKKSKCYKCT